MTSEIENILGLGYIDKERKIPGASFLEGREYRYVSCSDSADTHLVFKKIIREVNPPLPKNGGAINEMCKVTLPNGDCYFAISYKGDIEGWRKQVEQGVSALGLSIAKIAQDKLLLDDGNQVPLSQCEFRFE